MAGCHEYANSHQWQGWQGWHNWKVGCFHGTATCPKEPRCDNVWLFRCWNSSSVKLLFKRHVLTGSLLLLNNRFQTLALPQCHNALQWSKPTKALGFKSVHFLKFVCISAVHINKRRKDNTDIKRIGAKRPCTSIPHTRQNTTHPAHGLIPRYVLSVSLCVSSPSIALMEK